VRRLGAGCWERKSELNLVRRPALAVRCMSSGWSRVWLEGRLWERNWERNWERWWERNLGEHSLMGC
jgi:hypothetical protein